MIEHFSKWIELASLWDKSSTGVHYAFLDWIFSRIGVPTKIFLDQGMEFQEKIQELCEQALINHRTTFHDYHEVDDLIEGMVHISNKGLWKYGLQKERTNDWDI